jgi:uncharacterized damage-inducible protein DinB
MRALTVVFAISSCASAQTAADNPQVASSKGFYELIKGDISKTAEKVPEDKYAFKPSDDVRSMGQILAHVADAQYIFCGIVKDGKPTMKGIEKTAKTKADIIAAINDGFAFCDSVYAGLTDADSAGMVSFFGRKATKLSLLDFNIAHSFEHYGNLVTYMRINKIVPPSSEQAPKPK